LRLAPTTAVVSNNGTYSISALFKFTNVDGYRRIIDTTNRTSDDGLYFTDGRLQYWPAGTVGPTTIGPNQWVQVVLVRNAATDKFSVFLNGVKQFTIPTGGRGVLNPSHGIRFFLDNNFDCGNQFCGEESAGEVSRIRVFNSALSDFDAKNLDRTPVMAPPSLIGAIPGNLPRGTTNATVSVFGANLTPNTTLSLLEGIVVKSVTYVNSTEIRAVVDVRPTATPGLRDMLATTDLGSATCDDCFNVT
jgi:hypothetical protein